MQDIWGAPDCLYKIKNDELRFVFITSSARLIQDEEVPETATRISDAHGNEYFIQLQKSLHPKCIRCWHYREDVGQDPKHPEICARCASNLPGGTGESRFYA